jgi:hypothetical protein
MLDPKKSGSQIESHILVQREQRLPWTICLNGLGPEEFMSTVLIDISEKGCQTPRVYKNKSLKFLIKGAMEQRLHVPQISPQTGRTATDVNFYTLASCFTCLACLYYHHVIISMI